MAQEAEASEEDFADANEEDEDEDEDTDEDGNEEPDTRLPLSVKCSWRTQKGKMVHRICSKAWIHR